MTRTPSAIRGIPEHDRWLDADRRLGGRCRADRVGREPSRQV